MFKYKVNDMVRVRPDIDINESYSYVRVAHPAERLKARGKVYRVEGVFNKYYKLEGIYDLFPEKELMSAEFIEGDIVMLNPDARLGDFAIEELGFNRVAVFSGTSEMLGGELGMEFEKEYTVAFARKDYIYLEGIGDGSSFESALFMLIRRPKVKEITMAEVEEKFGCKVKIINDRRE